MWILGWLVYPAVSKGLADADAGLWRLRLMTIGLIWQSLLSMIILYREEGNIRWAAIRRRFWLSHPSCQFSPVMGPLVFGQSGPLPEVTIAKLLTRSGQPIGARQDHAVDSMGISFPGSSVPWALKRVPVMTIMLARWVKRSRPAEANSGLLKRVSDPRLPSLTLNGVELGNKK